MYSGTSAAPSAPHSHWVRGDKAALSLHLLRQGWAARARGPQSDLQRTKQDQEGYGDRIDLIDRKPKAIPSKLLLFPSHGPTGSQSGWVGRSAAALCTGRNSSTQQPGWGVRREERFTCIQLGQLQDHEGEETPKAGVLENCHPHLSEQQGTHRNLPGASA